MPTELPIACVLSAAELRARTEEIATLGREALIGAQIDGTRASLRFALGADVRRRVERFVAGERECCAFLTFRVEDDAGEIRVTIDAPAYAARVLAELVNAFRAG